MAEVLHAVEQTVGRRLYVQYRIDPARDAGGGGRIGTRTQLMSCTPIEAWCPV